MSPFNFSSVIKSLGQIKQGEGVTVLLMMSYSFLLMTSYTIVKVIARSKFIIDWRAENMPYIQLSAGVMIVGIMLGYSWLITQLPRRWSLPIIQAGIVGLLIGFWFLFRSEGDWVSAAFYLMTLILGLLLISQFWTLANLIYDVRQSKRLFGLIGAGAMLGGIAGSLITKWLVERITDNLLLVSAFFMFACIFVVIAIILRESLDDQVAVLPERKGLRIGQAINLLRHSKHLQTIALVICFAAVGAAIIDQQLNMAAEEIMGQENAIAGFLAELTFLISTFGLLIQLFLTSRIHRYLGIGFALLILPIGLGSTAVIVLLNAVLWAPGLARVLDQSLRYTVDKTTREILFMPLPRDIKIQAKTFVDVSVERFAKGLAAVLILFLIKPWGLNLNWQQVSYASLTIMVLWILIALRARRSYLETFRHSIEIRAINPSENQLTIADLSTVETLIEELASKDERRVIYAMDILESLDKKNLVTPLILYHKSPAVRIRALALLNNPSSEISLHWLPSVRRLLTDPDTEVRVAAIGALAGMMQIDVTKIVQPYLADKNPRIALTAAMVLTRSSYPDDQADAESVLQKYGENEGYSVIETRKELAKILRYIPDSRFCRLLIPLLTDSNLEVAQEAMRSVRHLGATDFIFVPTLVSLLRHPLLKASARERLIEYGQEVLNVLDYFLHEADEDIAVRRHIPSTVAHIPCRKAADILMRALEDPDAGLRFEAIAGLERLRQQSGMDFVQKPLERQVLQECERQVYYTNFHLQCFGEDIPTQDCLLSRSLREKVVRSTDRIFRLLGLIFPWKDIAAARWSMEMGGGSRTKALEYLDNLLPVVLRRHILPVLEQHPTFKNTSKGNATPVDPSDFERALGGLMHDRDPVISSTAIHMVWQQKLEQLSGDLEKLSVSHPVRDQGVVEAASWALGALRRPKDWVRTHSTEPMPTMEIAVQLNRIPLFASVNVNELFRVAGSGRQIHYQTGDTICKAESLSGEYLFLMEGRIYRHASEISVNEIDAPAPINFEEVLVGMPMKDSIKAIKSCVCLSLTLEEFQILLSDSTGLVEGLLRMLCTYAFSEIADPIVRSNHPPISVGKTQLNLTDKTLLFESFSVFSNIAREELLSIAAIASELRLAEGDELFGEMDPPAIHVVVSGLVVIEALDKKFPVSASENDAVGLYQMLSGIPLARRAVCASESVILRVKREDFLDLLLHRPELMRQMLGNLFTSYQT